MTLSGLNMDGVESSNFKPPLTISVGFCFYLLFPLVITSMSNFFFSVLYPYFCRRIPLTFIIRFIITITVTIIRLGYTLFLF